MNLKTKERNIKKKNSLKNCCIEIQDICKKAYKFTTACCVLSHVPTLRPMGCSPPGSSVCGIFQARILEWVAIALSQGASPTPPPSRKKTWWVSQRLAANPPSPHSPKGSCPPRISPPGFVQLAFNSDTWNHKGCVLLCVWVLHATWRVWASS